MHKIHTFINLSIAVLLLLAGASAIRMETRAAPAQQGAQEFVQITDSEVLRFWKALISGNGKKVAYFYGYDVYVADVSTGDSQLLFTRESDTPVRQITYDGSKVLTVDDRRIYINGVDVTPCYSDPRVYWDHCLEPPLSGYDHYYGAISGSGKYFFLASKSSWFCKVNHSSWDCDDDDHDPDLYRIWRVPVEGGEPQLWVGDDAGIEYLADYLRSDYGGDKAYASAGVGDDVSIFINDRILPRPQGGDWAMGNARLSADGQWLVMQSEVVDDSGHPCFERDCISMTPTDAANWQYLTPEDIGVQGWDFSLIDISENGWRITAAVGGGEEGGYYQFNRDGTDVVNLNGNAVWEYPSASYNAQNIAFISSDDLLGNGNNVRQVFVLKGPAAPDLSVDDITLDPSAITFDGNRFILPVDVTVRNVGDVGTANVPVRFSDNGGWSETRTIVSLDADSSTVLHLDWDITGLLTAGEGQATVKLTAAADPDDVIVELGNLNNSATAFLDVDARPRITEVKPTFTLDRSYFLDNETVNNPVKVYVDWNGDLSGTGDAPYGDVYFDLNGEQIQVAGQSWGAEHTYDMGSDFQAAFSCANNTLRVRAAYLAGSAEFQSLETVVQPTIFPFPGWVEWVITNIPGSDASFETTPEAPQVRYAYHFAYPEEPFEATWTPPGWMPYLGGYELGIQETQATADAEGKSDGAGSVGVSGQTGLGLGAVTAGGSLWGRGNAQFQCGESLDLTGANLGFDIYASVEKEAGLADVIPAVKAAENWPVVGRLIRWVNGIASVKASFTPGVEITTEFEERNDELKFVQGEGTGRIDAKVELATEPCEDLTASVYGGGTPYVTIQVPKNPGYLKEIGLDLYYGATFQAWEFEAAYERKVNCHYPGECSEVESEGLMAAAPSPPWHLIPRTYAGPAYARFAAPRLRVPSALQSTATTTETLLTNIYPRPEPALAVRSDGHRLLVYVHDDTARPHGRGTEIYSLSWNGSAWSGPVRLTDDTQPDFNPVVVYDGSGTGVALWERSTLPYGITPTLNITFAQSMEIAASVWNGISWSAPIALTNDSLMDRAPRLSAGTDGSLMSLW